MNCLIDQPVSDARIGGEPGRQRAVAFAPAALLALEQQPGRDARLAPALIDLSFHDAGSLLKAHPERKPCTIAGRPRL